MLDSASNRALGGAAHELRVLLNGDIHVLVGARRLAVGAHARGYLLVGQRHIEAARVRVDRQLVAVC